MNKARIARRKRAKKVVHLSKRVFYLSSASAIGAFVYLRWVDAK